MKKVIAALVLCFLMGCEKGTQIPRTQITETTHLRVIKINPDRILEIELLAPKQTWSNLKSCDDYDVMFVGHGQRVKAASRYNVWKEDVEVIYLKPKRSFVIDWKYRGPNELSEAIEGRTWYHVEIVVE